MYLEYYHSPIFIFSLTQIPTSPFFTPWQMNISGKNLPEIRWHRPHRAVFFTEVGIRRDVATNTQPSCLVLYHLSLSPYHWRDVFSPWPSPAPFSSCKTLQPLITFISRNGPLTPLQQANKERERKIFSVRREKREGKNLDKNWIDIHNYLTNIFFF